MYVGQAYGLNDTDGSSIGNGGNKLWITTRIHGSADDGERNISMSKKGIKWRHDGARGTSKEVP